MTALIDFLFPAPAPRTTGGIIGWWETRRLKYNLTVGGAGVVSLGATGVLTALPPDPRGLPPDVWIPILVFGVLANVCYALGPLAELAIDRLGGSKVLPTGPTLFRMGLTFSVGLTFLPTMITAIDWVYRILHRLF
jgi:hypothetical protein